MIIDDTHRLAFVHVPKCGGTSVSLQLTAVDSYTGGFRAKGVHPVLGPIHFAHIPLAFLRSDFPVEFDKIAAYRAFALLRDPLDRFASATFQRLEEFGGVAKVDITSALALQEARRVIRWLEARTAFCDLEYIHFSRQTDYINLDGRRIVENLYTLDNISALIAEIEKTCQVRLDGERRENTNFGSKNRILALIRTAKPIYSRLTPWAFREKILLLLKRLKIQSPDGLYEEFRQDAEIMNFVKTYYAEDALLLAETNRLASATDLGAAA